MLDGEIGKVFSGLEVVLKEVEERDVVGSSGHHDFVFLLKGLEGGDGLLDVLVLDVVDGFGDLHLRLNLGEVGLFEHLADPVEALDDVVLNKRSDELGSL